MYIGVDLGGTNIAVGLVDDACKIIAKQSAPTMAERSDKEIVEDMAKLSLKVVADAGYTENDIEWVGIGSPGSVNDKDGVLIYANNLPFRNTPMRDYFQAVWNKPVHIGNDANCAALGEAYAGAAKGCDTAVMITIGTGLGGGVIINRHIYDGFNHSGAELGHMVIVKDGRACTCGRKGCFEAYSSATGLIAMTAEEMKRSPDSTMWKHSPDINDVSGKTAFIAARENDAAGLAVVEKYIGYLSLGIVNLINIFQPEIFCVGGGVCKEGDFLLAPVRKVIENERYSRDGLQTELKVAALGNDAGIIGAAMLGK